MNRIEEKFAFLKKQGKKALMTFITAGDPDMAMTGELVLAMAGSGADIIELGVPFSDPLADGPVIQASSRRALDKNASLHSILGLVKKLRKRTDVPLVLMSYLNPVWRYGIADFVSSCESNGVDGVIVPDLVPEEASVLIRSARKKNISTIFLVSPTTSSERTALIAARCTGFVYYVSLTGVTGTKAALSDTLVGELDRIRRFVRMPIACGFGISNAAQAGEVSLHADGVIIGSAIVSLIERGRGKKKILADVEKFVSALKRNI